MQRRETATEYRFQERHVTKIRLFPTDQSGALQFQNVILNYTHRTIRDAPLQGDTQLYSSMVIFYTGNRRSVENYSSPKRF
jgi:hypothetical protein